MATLNETVVSKVLKINLEHNNMDTKPDINIWYVFDSLLNLLFMYYIKKMILRSQCRLTTTKKHYLLLV